MNVLPQSRQRHRASQITAQTTVLASVYRSVRRRSSWGAKAPFFPQPAQASR